MLTPQPPLRRFKSFVWRKAPAIGRSSDLQAFGLPTRRRFPVLDSDQCLMATFVPAHRCGAVLVSHQVPFFDAVVAYRQLAKDITENRLTVIRNGKVV